MLYTIDTNVAIVANGQPVREGERTPAIDCRLACVKFLREILRSGRVFLDDEREILGEYRRKLNPNGQPGVGDRFYYTMLQCNPERVEFVNLEKGLDGEYVNIAQEIIDARFDPSDRKFAAISAKLNIPVANAVDSDWVIHQQVLEANGVRIDFLCGCNSEVWFED